MLCPTSFVVDATENSKKGGVAAGAAPRLVCDCALFYETFMHVYVRIIRTTKYIQRAKKESPLGGQVSGWTCTCVQISGCIS